MTAVFWVLVLILVLAAGGYWWFFMKKKQQSVNRVDMKEASPADQVESVVGAPPAEGESAPDMSSDMPPKE